MSTTSRQLAVISKGWVRDAVLSSLSKGSRTASEIAEELGVSKARISYHTKVLLRRDMIEIADVKRVRGGVYSKTFVLKNGNTRLVRRREEQHEALTIVDEWFERLLMGWHLDLKRTPLDEVEIFLYHLFHLLAESGSLDKRTFEEFGERVGSELVSPSLKFKTMKGGIKELSDYLNGREMAQINSEIRKGEARLFCAGCFENKEYGGLVCEFTKGILEGVIKAKRGGKHHIERVDPEDGGPGCEFTLRLGRLTK
jgi:predicted hydrocarbon binding protein